MPSYYAILFFWNASILLNFFFIASTQSPFPYLGPKNFLLVFWIEICLVLLALFSIISYLWGCFIFGGPVLNHVAKDSVIIYYFSAWLYSFYLPRYVRQFASTYPHLFSFDGGVYSLMSYCFLPFFLIVLIYLFYSHWELTASCMTFREFRMYLFGHLTGFSIWAAIFSVCKITFFNL